MSRSDWLPAGLAGAIVAMIGTHARNDGLVCQSLTLVDANGAVIGKIGQLADGRSGIRIGAKDDRAAIEISIDRESGSPLIQFTGGESGGQTMSLGNGTFGFTGSGGAETRLSMDRNGQSSLTMLSGETHSSIELLCMKNSAMIQVSTPTGEKCSTYAASEGASFSIQKKDGARVWRTDK